MRLSRTDLFPVLAIIAGGAVGVFASGSLLLLSPSGDLPVPDPVEAPSMTPEAWADAVDRAERILRTRIDEFGVEEPLVQKVGAEVDPVETSPDVQWAPLYMPDASGGPRVYVRVPVRKDGTGLVDLSFRPDVESQERSLFYVDGERYGSSDLALDLSAVESIEAVKGPAAIALYGEEASAGVVRISLKEDARRQP